jgi:hypothetical protein
MLLRFKSCFTHLQAEAPIVPSKFEGNSRGSIEIEQPDFCEQALEPLYGMGIVVELR